MTSAPVHSAAGVYGLDLRWFNAIHPVTAPSANMLHAARGLAEGPLLVTAAFLALIVVFPRLRMRPIGLKAAVAALAALVANGLIGLAWVRPRPFIAGAGQAWVAHVANGSFPSDHLTLQWVVAGVLLLDRRTRWWGLAIALLGLPAAWARIYLGVHYPGDMLGACAMAMLATLAIWLIFRRRAPDGSSPIAQPPTRQ